MKDPSTAGRIFLVLAALLATLAPALAAEAKAPFERVIILGFDGADAHLVSQYMEEGRLPNLSKLKAQGYYAPLKSTNPPQTPVSWATFATGLNPGRTEIFDFLKRIEGTYIPDFAMVKEGKKPLLFGPRNPPILGAAAGVAVAIFALIVLALLRQRGLRLAGFALLAGALAGGGMALMASRWLPNELPDAANGRKGTPFWTVAA